MSLARLTRSAATLALAVAGLAVPVTAASVLTAGPAAATTCGGGPGVTVVVDYADIGPSTTTGCDGDGGGDGARRNFRDVGVGLRYASGAGGPGFVCKVKNQPSTEDCQGASPADAYWGLWWSDGTSGDWTYSGVGVSSLTVPAGGSVAFRFNNGDQTPPSVAPPVKAASSGSTGSGGSGGSGTSGGSGSSSGGAAPSSPTPSAPSAPSAPVATPSPSATAVSPTPTPSASAAARAQDDRGDRDDQPTAAAGSDRTAGSDGTGRKDATGQEDPKDAREGRDTSPTPAAEPETEQETTLVDDPVDPQASESAAADGLPVWVAPVLVAGLLLVGGAVAGVRRFRGAPGRP